MERYKSRDRKIIDLKEEVKEKGHSTLKDRKPKTYSRIGKLLLLGLLVASSTRVYSEYSEVRDTKLIEKNASMQEAFRSFKNINREEMGKYLSAQMDVLYQKYPNLDEMIFYDDEQTKTYDFMNDMYTLYKAFMVDVSEKEIQNMEDVNTTTVDQIIMTSDRLTEGQKKLIETHKEQYKHITDKYIQAKEETKDGAGLANEIYELLALELGLEPGVAKSEKIMEEIQEHGFYYDEKNNKFYTKEGPSSLVPDRDIEKMNETKKETQKTTEELELE